MRMRYDASVDILDIYFSNAEIVGSKEIMPGIVADFDEDRNIVSLEILDASARYSLEDLAKFSFEQVPASKP